MEFRAGIIGCGNMGKQYALSFKKLGVKVMAVADLDAEKGKEVANIVKATAYSDYIQMLEREDINIVGVCTPIGQHYKPVMEAAKRHIHIFCEKPFASCLEHAIEMVKFCERQGVKLGVGFNKRYEKVTSLAKEIADSGSIGDIWYFFVSYFQPEPPILWFREWGATLDTLVHQIDYANWILKEEPTQVIAEKKYFLGNKGEDKSFINIDYGERKKAIICGGYFRGFPPVVGTHDTCFQIVGERGYILGKRPDKLFLCNSAKVEQLYFEIMDNPLHYKHDSYVLELSEFLQAIENDVPPPITGEDGLRAQIVIEGIKKAHIQKKPVPLKPLKDMRLKK